MSESPSSSADLATIVELIDVYNKPEEDRVAKDSLLLIARIVQLLEPEGHGIIGHALDGLSTEVNAILSGMRSQLEALIGPKIGGLFLAAKRELKTQMELREGRINLLQSGNDPSEVLDQLKETGWVTHLSREEWIENDLERSQARQTEVWHLGKIQYDIQQLESLKLLFDQFVTTGEGRLGSK
jgi:hypothetical protein